MANVEITPGVGTKIATVAWTRDGVSENGQLVVLADPISAKPASVTDPGVAGIEALAVQGVPGGVALPVTQRGATHVGSAPTATNTQIASGAGRFYGMTCTSATPGSAYATAYDNGSNSASGSVLGRAGNGKDDSATPPLGVPFTNGLVIAVPSGGPAVTVYFSAETA